jgi:membrane protease YdiL (CAAX protease family)
MLLVGIFEETYCRYLLMDCAFMRFLGTPKWIAVIMSSFIFGAMHLMNPGGWQYTLPQAVAATGCGFWFAYLYFKKGLHFCIFTHGLYNFLISAFFLLK